MYKNAVEELCRPLILYMCEIWSFKTRASEPNEDKIINDINIMLNQIKDRCYSNPMLAQEFSYIEKPLIFFIDYTIKEGGFSFSKSWRNMSRKYEELSGDDKFFDILSLNLDDPMGGERRELFYLFMGLGFSGGRPVEQIEQKMKECLVKMPAALDINENAITADLAPTKPAQKAGPKTALSGKKLAILYISALLFAVVSFGINHFVFDKNVAEVEDAIQNAVISAQQNLDSVAQDGKDE